MKRRQVLSWNDLIADAIWSLSVDVKAGSILYGTRARGHNVNLNPGRMREFCGQVKLEY